MLDQQCDLPQKLLLFKHLIIFSLTSEASSNEFGLLLHRFSGFLIRYRKLTIILIPIGKGEGDNVIPCAGDVDLQAVRRKH